jgi:predicted enzyme related to lactoylglutathione lyase
VESLDATLAKVHAQKGKVLQPRTVIPGKGYVAFLEDTEGNVLGIIEHSATAGF